MICSIAPDEPPSGLQRAFLAWFEEARARLTVAIKVGCSTPDFTEFGFALANPVLIGSFTCGDLVISAEWEGECWDFLLSEEVRPALSQEGFVCSLCEQEGKHRIFATLEALWLDHLFRPLEGWINTKLNAAWAVALYGTDGGGTTWARLVPPANRWFPRRMWCHRHDCDGQTSTCRDELTAGRHQERRIAVGIVRSSMCCDPVSAQKNASRARQPIRRERPQPSGYRKMWLRIAKLGDLPDDVTPHVLRRNFASLAADLGYNEPTIASLLGHKTHQQVLPPMLYCWQQPTPWPMPL